mgnify:CR=1 FL=1
MLTTAFIASNTKQIHDTTTVQMSIKNEAAECFKLPVIRRLQWRAVNNMEHVGLKHPVLRPGDVVKQKSLLLDPKTKEEIGTTHTLATVIDEDVRLAIGAYNITKGPRVGLINFQALIPNHMAEELFDVSITSGTNEFHSANGYILISKPHVVDGALEREATMYICGLYGGIDKMDEGEVLI